jgi:hypothetical protein
MDSNPDPVRQALDVVRSGSESGKNMPIRSDPDPQTGQTPLVLLIHWYRLFFSNSSIFSTLSHPTRLIFGSDPLGGRGREGGGGGMGGRFRVLMIPVGHSMWAK